MNIKNCSVIDDIKTYPDNFFNNIFADPPYHLGTKYCIDPVTGGYKIVGQSKDFMNKWEGITPEQWDIFFKEAFRVMKYGGYCALFGMEESGAILQYYAIKYSFEITQSLTWFNIQGFPKSLSISKALDKKQGLEREIIGSRKLLGKARKMKGNNFLVDKDTQETDSINFSIPTSFLSKKYDGYHGGIKPLKPSLETIYVFRKPLKGKSIVDDILEYENGNKSISPACVNIDGNRVSYENGDKPYSYPNGRGGQGFQGIESLSKNLDIPLEGNVSGRYPSQLYVDSNAAELLNEQSGILFSGELKDSYERHSDGGNGNTHGYMKGVIGDSREKSEGGASKALHICDYENEENMRVYFNSKVANGERNAGLNTFENNHPTVKPLSLLHKIFNLFKLPIEDQIVYIPFSGTYSEVIGVASTGVKEENIYGCELDSNYIEIGKARYEYWKENKFYFKDGKKPKTIRKKEVDKVEETIFDII